MRLICKCTIDMSESVEKSSSSSAHKKQKQQSSLLSISNKMGSNDTQQLADKTPSSSSSKLPVQQQNNRLSNGSLFLTLPSNFSPSSGNSPGGMSPRGSCGGGSGSASPKGTVNKHSQGSSHHHHQNHHYTWEDLRRLFLVSLEKLSRMEPESIPFRQPVDPEELGIPDYHDIIRKPMDLQTIRNKMNTGKYTEPYAYVDDILLMLDNAWLYNREGSKVHEYCSRLSTVFLQEVNPVLTHLGYKEGRSNSFQYNSDQVINCHGRPVCFVTKGKGYWRDTTRDIEFNLCEACYKERFVEESTSPSTPDVIPLSTRECAFVFTINSSKAYSPAAELHKSHMRDAEMSRQLVLREFLRMLLTESAERKANVFKMLRCNGKLLGEFIEYIKRRRSVVVSDGGGGRGRDVAVVYGESFTTDDLDGLMTKLKNLKVEDVGNKRSSSSCAEEEEKNRTMTSDSGVESVVGSSNETLDLSLEGSVNESSGGDVDKSSSTGGGRDAE